MKYCIANWKMNMNSSQTYDYFDKLDTAKDSIIANNINDKQSASNAKMIICPPYTLIDQVSKRAGEILGCRSDYEKPLIGCQDINPNDNGAYTGGISIDMVKDFKVTYAILGHSERRSLFNESNEFINLKVRAVLDNDIKPILCIGETLEERETEKTEEILFNQLKYCLKGVSCNEDFLIAYEPVWAIGTGKNASNDMIESANNLIVNIIKELKYDIRKPKILYGGSVNNNNAKNLSKICNLDGFLIGGASLDAEQFYTIYNALKGE